MGSAQGPAWRMWATEYEVKKPGRVTIMARATDGAGEVQPLEAKANTGGYGNNSIQAVTVNVHA
jgi:hypothetical protein